MMHMVSIDPGIHGSGLGVFEGPRLVHAAWVSTPTGTIGAPAWLQMAEAVEAQVARVVPQGAPLRFIGERMVGYSKNDTKVFENLVDLTGVLGASLGRLSGAYKITEAHSVPPSMWKGQQSKKATWQTAQRCLDSSELEVVQRATAGVPTGEHDDVYDAVTIGLWLLQRFGRGRTA